MPKTVSATVLRGLRRIGLGLAGLVLFVVAVLILNLTDALLVYATKTVDLPNGAVVVRAFDWSLHPRVDLYASRKGPLLVRDIDMICWDETTIDGFSGAIERPDGSRSKASSFLWTKGEAKVLTWEDPEYEMRLRNSSLHRGPPDRFGLSGGYVGGDLLFRDPRYVLETPPPSPQVRNAIRIEAWARSPHRHPPRPVEVAR